MGEDCPAEYISWNDTKVYKQIEHPYKTKHFACLLILNGNMPHAVASIVKKYKYSGSNDIDEVAWYIENYQKVNMETKGLHIR